MSQPYGNFFLQNMCVHLGENLLWFFSEKHFSLISSNLQIIDLTNVGKVWLDPLESKLYFVTFKATKECQ